MRRAHAREARWRANRYSVPYRTDGPKVLLGVVWFILITGGALVGYYTDNPAIASVLMALVGAAVAAVAGLQAGFAWFPSMPTTRSFTAAAAGVCAVAGFYGPWGVPVGLLFGALVLVLYLVAYGGKNDSPGELLGVLVRSSLPVGLAMGSLAALTLVEPGGLNVAISLILLVSAYEVGDYLVGSGSANAFEGPLAGTVALGVVAFFLFLLTPEPFTTTSALLGASVAAVCCPLGQIVGSAILPHGIAWAPAVRRVDSYILAAPMWLILLTAMPGIDS